MSREPKWRAEAMFDTLRGVGLRPLLAEETQDGDHMAIVFDVMGNDTTPWSKAIVCNKAVMDPKAIVALWNDWGAQVRRDIAMNCPSEAVQKAVQAYGFLAVITALNPVRIGA